MINQKYIALCLLVGLSQAWSTDKLGAMDGQDPFYHHPQTAVATIDQPADKPSVLLSCLGGGTRGLFSAVLLEQLENMIGNGFNASSCDHFAGTSTGGLIAAAKAVGIPTARITDIYREHGSEIFYHSEIPFWSKLKHFFREKYSDEAFVTLDQEIFSKKKTLGEVEKHLTLVAYDVTGGSKTKPGPFIMDSKGSDEAKAMKLWECLRSTTAAPSYFTPFQTPNNRSLIDGGACSNDPTMAAISSIRRLDRQNKTHDFDNLFVLTLGTGFHSASVNQEDASSAGIIEVLPESLTWTTTGVQQMTASNCKDLLGKRYICLNPDLGKPAPALDDATLENLEYLESVAISYFTNNTKKMARAGKILQGIQE